MIDVIYSDDFQPSRLLWVKIYGITRFSRQNSGDMSVHSHNMVQQGKNHIASPIKLEKYFQDCGDDICYMLLHNFQVSNCSNRC
jgi:hypothetical protein